MNSTSENIYAAVNSAVSAPPVSHTGSPLSSPSAPRSGSDIMARYTELTLRFSVWLWPMRRLTVTAVCVFLTFVEGDHGTMADGSAIVSWFPLTSSRKHQTATPRTP